MHLQANAGAAKADDAGTEDDWWTSSASLSGSKHGGLETRSDSAAANLAVKVVSTLEGLQARLDELERRVAALPLTAGKQQPELEQQQERKQAATSSVAPLLTESDDAVRVQRRRPG